MMQYKNIAVAPKSFIYNRHLPINMECIGLGRNLNSPYTIWRYIIARKSIPPQGKIKYKPFLFVEPAWGAEDRHYALMREKYSVIEKNVLAEGSIVSDCGEVKVIVSKGGIPKMALEDIMEILAKEVDIFDITLGDPGAPSRKWVSAGYPTS